MSEPQSAARPPEAGILLPHEAVAAALAWPQARWEQGLAETPEEGVFAAGVLLAEMLTGTASEQRAAGRSHDALERRFQDLPEDWGRNLDPPLQAQITLARHRGGAHPRNPAGAHASPGRFSGPGRFHGAHPAGGRLRRPQPGRPGARDPA